MRRPIDLEARAPRGARNGTRDDEITSVNEEADRSRSLRPTWGTRDSGAEIASDGERPIDQEFAPHVGYGWDTGCCDRELQ